MCTIRNKQNIQQYIYNNLELTKKINEINRVANLLLKHYVGKAFTFFLFTY